MTTATPGEPSPRALGESLAALAAQVADLRGQIHAITQTTRHIGHADLLRERIDSAVDE